jgi:hypothetical protein
LADARHRQFHILARNGVHEGAILRGALAVVLGRFYGRADLDQQIGEVAELYLSNGALNRAAGGVARGQHDLGASHLTGELHTAQDVLVDDIAGHACVENITV